MKSHKLYIIADDFTGANDIGIQLKKYNKSVVTTYIDLKNSSGIEIVSTETRNSSNIEARKKTKKLMDKIKNEKYDNFYKKIDSTLRGNIEEELDEILKVIDNEKIMFIPAFPNVGRTVLDGIHYVNGTILEDTEFSRDPHNPIKESDITKIIKNSSLMRLDDIRNNFENSIKKIDDKVIIFDTETEQDLEMIAKNLVNLGYDRYIAGSAGIMNYLPKYWGYIENKVMMVSGSCSEKNSLQIENFLKHKKVKHILYNENKESESINEDVLIDSSKYCGDLKLLNEKLSNYIKEMLKLNNITRLFITGGETAINILKKLEIEGLEIIEKIDTGVMLGESINSDYFIITKPGAFGEEDIYNRCYEILKYR